MLEVEYDEDTNTVILKFSEEGVFIGLPANHDILGLWKKLGIPEYQKWLWEKQGFKCAECGKHLPKPRKSKMAYLHHDPPLGTKGSKAVDYKRTTRNKVLCYDCHKKYHSTSYDFVQNEVIEQV